MGSNVLTSKGCCKTCSNLADKDCDLDYNDYQTPRMMPSGIKGDEDDGILTNMDHEETITERQ